MFSPATLSIIGAVTGIVGAITGLAGLVLAWNNNRRVQRIKALDLRLELRKLVSDVRAVVEALPDLLERSLASRRAVLAASGLLQSGAFKRWKAAWDSDRKAVQALASEVPDAAETYKRFKQENLETKLVEVHALATKGATLLDKYLTALASDDKEREHIRADLRVRFNAERRAGQ